MPVDQLGILIEVNYEDDERIVHYQPAFDIHQITVGLLLRKIDEQGSENFKIDTDEMFRKEWHTFLDKRQELYLPNKDLLLKDL